MKLNCLILCDELKSLSVLTAALEKCEISRQICTEVAEAKHLLSTSRVNGVIIDCDDLESGKQFLLDVRQGKSNRSAVSFAIVNGGTSVRDAYAMGANFVLEKPLSSDLLLRMLKAGVGSMLAMERRSFRQVLDVEATVKSETGTHRLRAYNISESGIGLKNVDGRLKPQQLVTLTFRLPEEDTRRECKGEVVWVRDSGDAGLKLTQLPTSCAEKLQVWLHREFDQRMTGLSPASARTRK